MPQKFRASVAFAAALAALATIPAGAQTTISLPDSLYFPGDTVTWVKRLTWYCEGPAWNPATGDVTFSLIGSPGSAGNRPDWMIWRIKPGVDTGGVFYDKGQSNGQKIAPNGRLTVIQRATVIQFDANKNVDTLVASGANGVSFDANNSTDGGAGNDLSFASNGAFYFTNLATNIYYVDTAGVLSQVISNASSANGIFWIEEENRVYVHEGANIRRYEVQPNGALANRTTFANVSGMGADGGCIDSHGNRWAADYSGGMIRVFNAAGAVLGNITMRGVSGAYNARGGNAGNASNCAFGGPDLKTLYITGDGGLYSLRVKVAGRVYPGTTAIRAPFLRAAKAGRSPARDPRDLRGRLLPESWKGPVLKAFPIAEPR